jgi:HEAT repeat protein
MTTHDGPSTPMDQCTDDELVALALSEERDDADERRVAWVAIDELRRRATPEVYALAEGLSKSTVPLERKLALDVLGQLGLDCPFREETVAVVDRVLATEDEEDVVQAAVVAFGHLHDVRGRAHLLALASHPAAQVRQAVAWALPSCAQHDPEGNTVDPEALVALMALMEDEDDYVRDWATFGVGQQFSDDTPEVRHALAARLNDGDEDTWEEAVCGLARRHDDRAIEPLNKILRGSPGSGAIEAATEMADPRLVEALQAALDSCDRRAQAIREALDRCRASIC